MKNNEEKITNFYRSYVRIPRSVIYRQFSENESERKSGQLMALFYAFCNFRENDFFCNGKRITLRKGEMATTYTVLGNMTGFSRDSLRYQLKRLREEGSIEVRHYAQNLYICVVNYGELDHIGAEKQKQQQSPHNTKRTRPTKHTSPAETPPVRLDPDSEEQRAISCNAKLLRKPDLNAFKRRAGEAKNKSMPEMKDFEKQTAGFVKGIPEEVPPGSGMVQTLEMDGSLKMERILEMKRSLEKARNLEMEPNFEMTRTCSPCLESDNPCTNKEHDKQEMIKKQAAHPEEETINTDNTEETKARPQAIDFEAHTTSSCQTVCTHRKNLKTMTDSKRIINTKTTNPNPH